MIRFESTLRTFTEVPDEISLCINCTCCPLRCKGCFEPWLRENSGYILNEQSLKELLLIVFKGGSSIDCNDEQPSKALL